MVSISIYLSTSSDIGFTSRKITMNITNRVGDEFSPMMKYTIDPHISGPIVLIGVSARSFAK